MKKNVRFMLKVVIISVLFMLVVAARSFAAEVNMNSIDFTNIPESNSGTGTNDGSSNNAEDEAAKKKAEEDAAAKKKAEEEAAAKKKAEEEAAKKKTTSTSSASSTKMPATGSNIEIIFGVAAIVIVSGAIFFYKKQNIKLK